jgi:hypothetical protein
VLRLVCREFVEAVAAAARECFPRARCANVKMVYDSDEAEVVRTAPVVDADFVHFEELRELHMARCTDVTDAAFVHLRGVLVVYGCS